MDHSSCFKSMLGFLFLACVKEVPRSLVSCGVTVNNLSIRKILREKRRTAFEYNSLARYLVSRPGAI